MSFVNDPESVCLDPQFGNFAAMTGNSAGRNNNICRFLSLAELIEVFTCS
jgi:hypothetical protein